MERDVAPAARDTWTESFTTSSDVTSVSTRPVGVVDPQRLPVRAAPGEPERKRDEKNGDGSAAHVSSREP